MEVKKEWLDWLACADTGMSSKTMFSAITGIPVGCDSIPGDLADIGRCVRMLRKLPELRSQLQKVIDKHPEWMPFIDCWKELENGYDQCVKWEHTPPEEQKKLQRQKYFIIPNNRFWNTMQQLHMASKYMGGMRCQNSSSSWRNQPPKEY